jgi:hypothetical protein
MRFRLRTLRVLAGILLTVIVVAVFVPVVGPLIYNYRELHKRLRVGREIVAAVNEFKSEKARWPTGLDELVPTFLPKQPPPNHRWRLEAVSNEPPHLRGFAGMHRMLIYYFPPTDHLVFPEGTDQGWILNDEGTESFLPGD